MRPTSTSPSRISRRMAGWRRRGGGRRCGGPVVDRARSYRSSRRRAARRRQAQPARRLARQRGPGRRPVSPGSEAGPGQRRGLGIARAGAAQRHRASPAESDHSRRPRMRIRRAAGARDQSQGGQCADRARHDAAGIRQLVRSRSQLEPRPQGRAGQCRRDGPFGLAVSVGGPNEGLRDAERQDRRARPFVASLSISPRDAAVDTRPDRGSRSDDRSRIAAVAAPPGRVECANDIFAYTGRTGAAEQLLDDIQMRPSTYTAGVRRTWREYRCVRSAPVPRPTWLRR